MHPGMVWIPAALSRWAATSIPRKTRRSVAVDGFWMDRTEVTNAEFAQFVRDTNYVTVAERQGKAAPPSSSCRAATQTSSTAASWWRYVEGANWRHPGRSRHLDRRPRPLPRRCPHRRRHRRLRQMERPQPAHRSPMGMGRARRRAAHGRSRATERRQHLARRLPAHQHQRRRLRRHGARRLLQAQRVRSARHDRQRLGMDRRRITKATRRKPASSKAARTSARRTTACAIAPPRASRRKRISAQATSAFARC